jgi:hypothetical protein
MHPIAVPLPGWYVGASCGGYTNGEQTDQKVIQIRTHRILVLSEIRVIIAVTTHVKI